MPVVVTNNTNNNKSNIKKESMLYFDKALTHASSRGLINDSLNPANLNVSKLKPISGIEVKKKYTSNDLETKEIPILEFHPQVFRDLFQYKLPEHNIVMAESQTTQYIYTIELENLIIEERIDSQTLKKKKTVNPNYIIGLYTNPINNQKDRDYNPKEVSIYRSNDPNSVFELITTKIDNLGAQIYYDDFKEFFESLSIKDMINEKLKEWTENIPKNIERVIKTTAHNVTSIKNQLLYISNYKVDINEYIEIFDILDKNFKPEEVEVISKVDLNVELQRLLKELNAVKDILPHQVNDDPVKEPKGMYSLEQKKAILTESPLVLVQSGAGTGKSHTILGKIDYMIETGIKPDDILVLSFTNAAADNITNRNPKLKSMTIASMVHTIYEKNYPTHILSTIDILVNTIDIYYGTKNSFANTFKRTLSAVKNASNESFTRLSLLIEDRFLDTINLLNKCKQTTLELEIIIAYLQIEKLTEPDEIKCKHIIIDEVQDNSVFEFVYTLKYALKNKCSLFSVGDCSQTLYEFRASNPKALNMLESSGVFDVFTLMTNYRSKQEILDVANVLLGTIEANQYSNLRLKANSFIAPTQKTFKETVDLKYIHIKDKELQENATTITKRYIKAYIDKCLANNEQITLLAYAKKTLWTMKNAFMEVYPNLKAEDFVMLSPDRTSSVTIFSSYIKNYWNVTQFAPSKDIISFIKDDIMMKYDRLNRSKNYTYTMFYDLFFRKWQLENKALIKTFENKYISGQMTKDELLENIKNNMLNYEISYNIVSQSLMSKKNEERKSKEKIKKAKIILSTIHSAKGLEFDNVIVMYKDQKDMVEANKRMYYVALTRAVKSELIIAYSSEQKSKLEMDYETILKSLKP